MLLQLRLRRTILSVRSTDLLAGHVNGYDFREDGEAGAADGSGYYRREDAEPPDEWEYSRIVLQRASGAGADFVACPQARVVLHCRTIQHELPHHAARTVPAAVLLCCATRVSVLP